MEREKLAIKNLATMLKIANSPKWSLVDEAKFKKALIALGKMTELEFTPDEVKELTNIAMG